METGCVSGVAWPSHPIGEHESGCQSADVLAIEELEVFAMWSNRYSIPLETARNLVLRIKWLITNDVTDVTDLASARHE